MKTLAALAWWFSEWRARRHLALVSIWQRRANWFDKNARAPRPIQAAGEAENVRDSQ